MAVAAARGPPTSAKGEPTITVNPHVLTQGAFEPNTKG